MAPQPTNSARQQRRRTRIIPAVPLPFSRPAPSPRPITPEGTAAETSPKQPSTSTHKVEEESTAGMQTPLTPDSKVSTVSARGGVGASPETVLAEPAAVAEAQATAGASPSPIDEKPSSKRNSTEAEQTSLTNDPAAPVPPFTNGVLSPATSAPEKRIPLPNAPGVAMPQLPHMSAHQRRPTVGSVVFGASPDSPSFPSTPHEPEVDGTMPRFPPRPPPGITIPGFATPGFPPNHVHHPSDVGEPLPYPPTSLPPPGGLYYGRDFPPTLMPSHYGHHPPFPRFSPGPGALSVNGAAETPRSLSRSPVKSQPAERKPISEYGSEHHPSFAANGPVLPALDPKMDDTPFELAGYMLNQFGNPEFADFLLHVSSEDATLFSMPVHAIVVSRSRAIASAIQAARLSAVQAQGTLPRAEIRTTDKVVTREAMLAAIKSLYGDPFVPAEAFLWTLPPFSPNASDVDARGPARTRMEHALSLAAAGFLLQMPAFVGRSANLVRKLLRWDTLDQVLRFALDGASKGNTQSTTYGLLSAELLQYVVNFLALAIPAQFQLYTAASELAECPRLPIVAKTLKLPSHNPRLSKIKFGDIPAEDDVKPNYVVRFLTSVLVSLPFPMLAQLCSHTELVRRIGRSMAMRLMMEVVAEREDRRKKALEGAANASREGTLSENLYWRERIEELTDSPSGFILNRDWSGPASEE